MAIPPYARLLVSLNSGPPLRGRVVAAPSDVVELIPESTASWGQQLWEIYAFPEGWTAPVGWTTTAGGTFVSSVPRPPSFALPPAGPLWGKWLFRLVVNEGKRGGKADPDLTDEDTGVSVPSPRGLHDLAALEGRQFDARRAWVRDHQANLRVIDAALAAGASVGWAGDLAGSTNLAQRVSGLQGVPVAPTAPAPGNALVFDGTGWSPVGLPHVMNVGVWKHTTGGAYDSFAQTTFGSAATATLQLFNVAASDIFSIDVFVQAAATQAPGSLRVAIEDANGLVPLPETEVTIDGAGALQRLSLPARYDTRVGGTHRVLVQGRLSQLGGALELRNGATIRALHVRPS